MSYHRVGGVCKALGGQANLERTLELYQRGLECAEALAREQNTARSRRDLAICHNKVGEAYEALGGQANLERALEGYQRGLELAEALAREQGTAQSRRDLIISCNRVGGIYEALGDQANLKRALELYRRGMELAEALVRELNTVSAYDDLAVSYYHMGSCLPEGTEERRRYLVQYLELSERLFRQTQSQRHQEFVEEAHQLLGEGEPAAQPTAHPTKRSLWSRLFGQGK